jgi:hypothetical protein
MRRLFRQRRSADIRNVNAQERREIFVRNFLSNLPKTRPHPTLNTLLEIADAFSLTLDGAHQLFGYRTKNIRKMDLVLNGAYTRVIESYPFDGSSKSDVPAKIRSEEFLRDAFLGDLVSEWRMSVPVSSLHGAAWREKGSFYIQVGKEDSLGAALPPGSIALITPVSEQERRRPDPRTPYFIQFGNGYRCSRCVASRNRLILLNSGQGYGRQRDFAFPAHARIAGRVRMFALGLPLSIESSLHDLPISGIRAPLILPWEHSSMEQLFSTEHVRFQRPPDEGLKLRDTLRAVFNNDFSERTERRYRSATRSKPHVDTLIQLSLSNFTRYTDALRTNNAIWSDRNRFSLQTLLRARHLPDISPIESEVPMPEPQQVWRDRLQDYGEWPSLLSLEFPHLAAMGGTVVRVAHAVPLPGTESAISAGTFFALEKIGELPPTVSGTVRSGWACPLYVLQRKQDLLCGPLDNVDGAAILRSTVNHKEEFIRLSTSDLPFLHRVIGAAVPV